MATVIKGVFGIDVGGLAREAARSRTEPEVGDTIDIESGGLGDVLHEVGRGRLTLEAGIHFQQGRYAADVWCSGSADDIERLRAALTDAMRSMRGVEVIEDLPGGA